MRRFPSPLLRLPAVIFLVVQSSSIVRGQTPPPSGSFVFEHASSFSALPNGVEVSDGVASEEITALREDVLRIRIVRQRPMPEDASWAVLAEARHSSVAVTPDVTPEHYSFRTHLLAVEIDRKTLRLTVRDIAGNILLAGCGFRKHGGQQIIGAHALDLRRNFLSAHEAQQGQGTSGNPAPARGENR